MFASDDRPPIEHNWRCRQDPADIEQRTLTDCDTGQRIPVWRCRCGGWTPIEPEGDDAA